MLTLRSILCPVDFSDQSRHALRWAVALAARHRARLTVVTAVDPLLAEAARVRLNMNLAETESRPALRDFVASVVPAGATWAPQVALDVRVGDAPTVILESSAREPVDLIVMGTQGLGGFRKLLLGSTAERVLRRTHTPVLAVPPHETDSITLDPGGPRIGVSCIVAGTDFSQTSTTAVRWAADLAQDLAAMLVLVHVVEPVSVPAQWQAYVDQADEARAAEARAKLEQLAESSCGARPCDIAVSLGRPADSIAASAEARGAGLIVMGLAGDQERPATRPGSIAYRVLCLAKVPVLVVPPQSMSEGPAHLRRRS